MNLPVGTEPLVLADGTIINPVDGSVVANSPALLIEIPNAEEAQRIVVAQRRRIADLPVPPKQLNTISVILTYSLMGVSDEDIGLQLGLSPEQVGRVKMSDAYAEITQVCTKNIIESDKDHVRNMFVANAKHAANKTFELLGSKRSDVAQRAADSILDRAGLRAVDVVEHRHKVEGGLRIEYVDKQDTVPTIEHSEFAKGEF